MPRGALACGQAEFAKILADANVIACIVRELSLEEEFRLRSNYLIDVSHLGSITEPPYPINFLFEVQRASQPAPKYLTVVRHTATYSDCAEELNWTRGLQQNGVEYRWLLLFTLQDKPPFHADQPYRIAFPDIRCGVFQIKDDPLDNRLGVDLEVLYEDLQIIISHRPDWPSVPAGQLQTDFAKAVLERLRQQVAQPDQGNSEPSEVGRQAAE